MNEHNNYYWHNYFDSTCRYHNCKHKHSNTRGKRNYENILGVEA